MDNPQYIAAAWLIFGAIFVAFEAIAVPGIGFLFIGLAAISVGGLITFGVIDAASQIIQVSSFLGLTFIWAGILWVPMKKFQRNRKGDNYSNMIGETAIVQSEQLTDTEIGKVKWSGAIMRAKLDASAGANIAKRGDEVIIKSIEGNLLTVVKTIKGEK